jgi:predicted aspartyl protease
MNKIKTIGGLILCASLWLPFNANAGNPLSQDIKGRPTTMVTVNESAPLKFVIDTAAQTSAVGQQLITQLSLEPDPDKTARLHGAAGITEVPMFSLDSVTIGGTTFRDVLAPTLSHIPDSEALGIIGMNLFAGKRVLFDQANGEFSVGESGSDPHSPGMSKLPVDFIYGTFARVKISIGGVSATALIDTGAQRTVANRKLLAALDLTEHSPGLSTVTQSEGATGHDAELVVGYEGEITLQDASFDSISVDFADLPVFHTLQMSDGPALILGDDVLNQLTAFAIDFGAAQFEYMMVN